MRAQPTGPALRLAPDGDAQPQAVAAATVRALASLFAQLTPLVGALATQALYRRALHLAGSSFERPGAEATSLDQQLDRLGRDLAARAPADAQRAGDALLRAFVGLLVSLIGAPLTHRMVRSAWGARLAESFIEEKTP